MVSFLAMFFLFYAFIIEMTNGVTDRAHFSDLLWFDSTMTFFFLSVLTISTATLFTSGIKKAAIYKTAIGSFIVTMGFFLLVVILQMMTRPLIFD